MRNEINYCKNCNNICDVEICEICSNPHRNRQLICVVEDIRDVIAIENTSSYIGLYHVLGGKISPMDGLVLSDLNPNGHNGQFHNYFQQFFGIFCSLKPVKLFKFS